MYVTQLKIKSNVKKMRNSVLPMNQKHRRMLKHGGRARIIHEQFLQKLGEVLSLYRVKRLIVLEHIEEMRNKGGFCVCMR
jgi:hypothetical protein